MKRLDVDKVASELFDLMTDDLEEFESVNFQCKRFYRKLARHYLRMEDKLLKEVDQKVEKRMKEWWCQK